MEKQMTFPKLRFPEFKGEWKMEFGNKLFEPISNKTHNSDLPILAISQEFGAVPREMINYQISVSEKSIDGYKVIEKGDFIISLRSFQGGIEYSNFKGICSPAYIILRSKIEINDHFYKIYFKSNNYIQALCSKLEGIRDGKMISYKYFSEIALPFPTLAEQKHIASFFTILDKKIAQLKTKKQLLQQYKKGVMQQLFSQELRFKDENGKAFPKWEMKKLGEVCEIKKGEQLNKEDLTEKGTFPCLNGGINYSGYTEEFNSEENTITISEGGASCGFINFMTTKFWLGGHCYKIILTQKINQNYFYQLLKFNEQKIMKLRVGSGLPNIQQKDLRNFEFVISNSIEEQTKIANFLSSLDEKINHTETQIQQTQTWKKGLLQKMFV